MRDQVEALRQAGVARRGAQFLAERRRSRAEVREPICRGELDLLYVAPERLTTPGFRQMLAGRR